MPLVTRIEEFITPALENLGYAVVRVLFITRHRACLEIMIERLDGKAISIDDCTNASITISTLLDKEDPIESSYELEVTSTGIDRPLVKLKDYSRFVGESIMLQTSVPINGQKNFEGLLQGCEGDSVVVLLPNDIPHVFPFDTIIKAKLLRSRALKKSISPYKNLSKKGNTHV